MASYERDADHTAANDLAHLVVSDLSRCLFTRIFEVVTSFFKLRI